MTEEFLCKVYDQYKDFIEETYDEAVHVHKMRMYDEVQDNPFDDFMFNTDYYIAQLMELEDTFPKFYESIGG